MLTKLRASFRSPAIAPAASGLYPVAALLLSMYRAIATRFYETEACGNMLMYTDTSRLCDVLKAFGNDLDESVRAKSRLGNELKTLGEFGKRAYGKEMESQRTILRDLLDNAQGFANCTEEPFASECEKAIDMTVRRVRELHDQWSGILSESALLQSTGSLVATAISKFILDVEDLSDISEQESEVLRRLCAELSKLSELFAHKQPSGEVRDTIGVYTSNWFKFQYFSELLASSLADIKYLWLESELRLEYTAEELIDLIEALFVDSEHRRKAISEIRRNPGPLRQ